MQISMENFWTVVEGSNLLAEGQVALRSVEESGSEEAPPYTGWEVESEGSFVIEPAVTVNGDNFAIYSKRGSHF